MKNNPYYPHVAVKKQSFLNVKKTVLPKQSMSLREIVRRFVRNESLPISKEGLYEERFGDLEKLSKKDITEQMEAVDSIKSRIKKFENEENERIAKQQAEENSRLKIKNTVGTVPSPKSGKPKQGGGEPPLKSPPIGA